MKFRNVAFAAAAILAIGTSMLVTSDGWKRGWNFGHVGAMAFLSEPQKQAILRAVDMCATMRTTHTSGNPVFDVQWCNKLETSGFYIVKMTR
jgi:hypothetical protein